MSDQLAWLPVPWCAHHITHSFIKEQKCYSIAFSGIALPKVLFF